MLGNGWKNILNRVSWFVFIIQNFDSLCDAYRIIRHYTVLLRINRIFCLILGITFGNYILSVSNEDDDHLWLYFLFLNYPPMYEGIDVKFLHIR